MTDRDGTGAVRSTDRTDEADELRTLGFRLREIQRLLAVRVEQENRRLDDEGIEPVEESRFVAGEADADDKSR